VVNDAETKILALQTEIANLKTELEAKTQEIQTANSQYLRLTADFDNFRRRSAKEKEDLEQQIKRKTLSELLSVVDNFERARTQIKPANDGEMAIHKSYQGVYKTLVDSLKRLGVSAMRPEGKPFDPNYHEAMLREPTNEHPEGTVLEQMVRGYLLNDQVLRHAMVKVSTPTEEAEEDSKAESLTVESESANNN
jgi:molecular chaperone GrpE